jgi:putative flippase GtrA
MIKLLDNYIKESDNTSWYHKYKEVLLYLFFGGCTTLVNIVSFLILRCLNINLYASNVIAWLISVLFAFVTNKLFVFESDSKDIKKTFIECIYFFGCRLLSLLFDMGIMYLLVNVLNVNEVISKIVSNIFVIIINYFFSKLIVFKK